LACGYEEMTLSEGTRLGRYEIRSQIGAGGMGEVYLAQDTKLDRKVALKILPSDLASNSDRMERFIREAKSAAALNHPHIAQVFEIGEQDGSHFIAMEFIDGVTLRDKIYRERPELRKLLRVLQQVAEGLSKAHAAGIVHRDLKPDNIMITRDGFAKVLDFGLAKLVEKSGPGLDQSDNSNAPTNVMQQGSVAGMVMGTVGYMSPEQAQGKTNETDQRSDIFSFGCILFEAITGKKAFEGDSIIKSLHSLIYEPAPLIKDFNPSAPAELQRIVRRCLAKDPDERYQSIKEVAIELKELRREIESGADSDTAAPVSADTSATAEARTTEQTGPTATSSAGQIGRRIQRRKTAVFFLVALALVACIGLAYWLFHSWVASNSVAHFENMNITRVTGEGNVESVAISPDGKYIAYSIEESGKRSLWTKHLGTGSRVPIVAAVEASAMNASTFSPDGGYVYYTRVDEQNPKGGLYQAPVLGGVTPKKILADVSQPVSISPDGKQIAFGRYHLTSPDDELLVANIDGTNERSIVKVVEPDWLSGARAAWSPDAKMLAVGYGSQLPDPQLAQANYVMTIAVVSLTNPSLKPITSRGWPYIGNVSWHRDGSGVVFIAREQRLAPLQIWQASYPGGEARRLTNDLSSYDYYSLSLTADGRGLVAVQTDPVSNIWAAAAGEESRARAVTPRRNVQEGHYGLAWTPDGKLVYDSDVKSKASIWIVNADGSDPRPLTDGLVDDYMPEVSPDGRYIVFASARNGFQLWRMDIDGGNPKQLTFETGAPTCSISPDGRWVIYSLYLGGIFKVSIDGGPRTELVAKGNLRYPQVSPDGKLVAYAFDDDITKRPKIAVILFDGGSRVKTFDLPLTTGTSFYESSFYHGFHWSPDGRALIFINTLSGVSNLWRQPLNGGAAQQITDFKTDLIYNFAYSGDGRQLAFARGNHTRDAVLISETK
jgi:eukaryotic-like serine/threonine-protein kinase